MANPSIYKIVDRKAQEQQAKTEVTSEEQTEITNHLTKFITHFKHQHL